MLETHQHQQLPNKLILIPTEAKHFATRQHNNTWLLSFAKASSTVELCFSMIWIFVDSF